MRWRNRLEAKTSRSRPASAGDPCAHTDRPKTGGDRASLAARLQDRNAFPHLFEDQVKRLSGRLSASDHDCALAKLETIVEHSGYNR
jgi:hypothetical protein